MYWRIGLVSCALLSSVPAYAHEPILLDARSATPGLRLELSEPVPTKVPGDVGYRLQAAGLPRGIIFNVWAKDFGHSFHEAASGFQVDQSGTVVSSELDGAGRPGRLEELVFGPGPYPRGAIWEVALVSADHALKAFAKVIPHPISARDGSCAVSLEIISRRGERFVATGAGFAPGDEVITELRYGGRVIQKRQRVSAEGRLPPDVISHGSIGADRSARYVAKGRSCEVAVEYEWGEPALKR